MPGEYREGTRSGERRWDGRGKLTSRAGFSLCPIGCGRRADCPEITTAGPASAAMIRPVSSGELQHQKKWVVKLPCVIWSHKILAFLEMGGQLRA